MSLVSITDLNVKLYRSSFAEDIATDVFGGRYFGWRQWHEFKDLDVVKIEARHFRARAIALDDLGGSARLSPAVRIAQAQSTGLVGEVELGDFGAEATEVVGDDGLGGVEAVGLLNFGDAVIVAADLDVEHAQGPIRRGVGRFHGHGLLVSQQGLVGVAAFGILLG